LGVVTERQGDYTTAQSFYTGSLTLKRKRNDPHGIAVTLNNLGVVAECQGDYTTAQSLYEESLTLKRRLNDKSNTARSLGNLGRLAARQGLVSVARARLDEGLAISRAIESKPLIGLALNGLGLLAEVQGDFELAQTHYQESLALRWEIDEKHGIIECLTGVASVDMRLGWAERAVNLLGGAQALREQLGVCPSPIDKRRQEEILAMAQSKLGATIFKRAWAYGQSLSLERLINLARQTPMTTVPPLQTEQARGAQRPALNTPQGTGDTLTRRADELLHRFRS
jgi:tetratricopeptide (TPR) repeat protein